MVQSTSERPSRKLLVWLSGEIKTPPFSREARVEAGTLLRRVQEGEPLGKPHSEPVPIQLLATGKVIDVGSASRTVPIGPHSGPYVSARSFPDHGELYGVGRRCHELKVRDENRNWRVVYRVDPDAIVIAKVFPKTTRALTDHDIDDCRKRLRAYDEAARKAIRKTNGG